MFFLSSKRPRAFLFQSEKCIMHKMSWEAKLTRVHHDFPKDQPELDAQAYRALLMTAIDDGDVFEIERLLPRKPSFPKIFDFFDASGETPLTLSAERGDARTPCACCSTAERILNTPMRMASSPCFNALYFSKTTKTRSIAFRP